MPTSHLVDHPSELLSFLFATHPDVKRTKVRQWLKHGAVQVNGKSVGRFNHALRVGDVVSIRTKQETLAEELLPPGIEVLFEDESLIVIDKPAGLLSMASETERRKTAYAYLTDYVRRGDPRSQERVWIVHRLDRDASGLMVFAKTEAAKRALQADWHQAEKRYLAVVEGSPPAESGVLRSHLDESNPYRVFSARPSEQTRLAVTNYRVVKKSDTRSLLELTIETGRRNQIRVQLADIACPIIGDRKYQAATNPAGRLGLHASSLQFQHPISGAVLAFDSHLPRNLSRLV